MSSQTKTIRLLFMVAAVLIAGAFAVVLLYAPP